LEQALDWLKKPHTAERIDTAGGQVYRGGKVVVTTFYRACHYFLIYYLGKGFNPTVASLTCNGRDNFDREVAVAFYAWAFGASGPYAAMFPGGFDAEFAADYGFLFVDCDRLPPNFVYNAAIASRFPTEHPHHAADWSARVKLGVHPGLAWWSVYMTRPNSNPNHQAFDWRRVSETYVKNLCAGTIANPTTGNVFPCNVVWGDANTGGSSGDSVSSLDPLIQKWPKLYPGLYRSKPDDLVQILLKEQERLELR
jgi:hypothetical protein